MNAPDFHANRLTGIGSSDAPAVLGVSKWASPLDVYLRKRGEADPVEENEAMRWGTVLQPVVLSEFRRRGFPIYSELPMLRCEKHPFMIAHLDAALDTAVVEAKTARSAEGWGEDGSAEAPAEYIVQTHHQMIVTNLRRAYIPVLIAGSDFRVIDLEFDDELGGMIIEAEREMWQRIQDGEPPAPRSLADVNALYRRGRAEGVEADEEIAQAWGELVAIKRTADRCEKEAEERELKIKAFLGERDELTYHGTTLATWREQVSWRLDSKRLKNDNFPMWSDYAKECISRTFLTKEPK